MPAIRVAVVGTKFHGANAVECAARAPVGYVARLVRDRDNKYDPNAVAVWLLGLHCGFVPRAHNAALAAAMDAGAEVAATVVRQGGVRRGRMEPEPLIEVTWQRKGEQL